MRRSSHCRPPAHRVAPCPLSGLLLGGGGTLEVADAAYPVNFLIFCPNAGPHGTARTSRPCWCSRKYRVFSFWRQCRCFQAVCQFVGVNLVFLLFRALKGFKATLVNRGNPACL